MANGTATNGAAATAPAIADGTAGAGDAAGAGDTGPLNIWLDPDRKAILIASKGQTIQAESGANGNRVEADPDRPTRAVVGFRHWEPAYAQLQSGKAELVCRPLASSSAAASGNTASGNTETGTTGEDTSRSVYHSVKDEQDHVKISEEAVPLAPTYSLEFRKTGASDGQQLAKFTAGGATAAGEGAATSAGPATDSSPNDTIRGLDSATDDVSAGHDASANHAAGANAAQR
jgi:hypothetical protein